MVPGAGWEECKVPLPGTHHVGPGNVETWRVGPGTWGSGAWAGRCAAEGLSDLQSRKVPHTEGSGPL